MRKLLTILLMIVCLGVSTQSKAQSCSTVPVINSFSPNTGFIGSKVTIFGANFDSNTITNNVVYFGSTKATVVSATFGQLVVVVPVGASTAPISVTNQCNRTAYSTVSFNGIFCPTPLSGQTYQNVAFDLTGIYGAYNMISQDLDLDGKPEVISSANNGGLTIAVNNSTPGLLSFSAINSTAGGQSIYAADFDGDGKKDLLSTYQVSRNTSTLGNVSMASSQSIPQVSGYQIAAGDFNNDGKIDIIGEVGSNVMIAFNTSTGPGNISFGPAQFFGSVGTTCTGIQVADIDGDGKTDFIASQGNADRAVSIRNTTTVGSMTPSAEAPEYWASDSNAADGLGTYPYRAQIADFDKDGKIDFTSCNYNGATNVAIWRNISSVGNITFAPTVNLDAPQNNYRIGVGDVDGDGYPDVVTKSLGINVFSVYKNTSTGAGAPTFGTRIDYTSSNQAEVSGIVIGDLDGDFVPDIATSGINSNRILFHRNTSFQADNTAPTAIAQNIVAALAPNGTVTVTAAQVDNGSSDACGIKTITLSQTLFTCANIGANPVTLTVTDNAGNVSTANAIVNVQPAAIIVAGQTTVCQGGTIPLTANLGDSYQWYNNGVVISGATNQNYTATQTGSYTVAVTNAGGCSGISLPTVVTVNNNPVVAITGKTDTYCPGEALVASQSSLYQWSKNGVIVANATLREFYPDGPGTYSVAVIDLFGCSAVSGSVTISPDTTIPTIVLNGATQVTIGSNTVFNDPSATANDNCSTTIVVTSNLNLNTPGVYTISYKAVDGSGNESVSVTRQVTVLDATAPVVKAGRVTIQLDANGQATVVPASLNNGSTDNGNGALTFSLDKSVFDCTNLNSGTGGTLTAITSVGSVNRRNFSVGAGFNPNTGEYWMPEWAGSTVYRVDVAGNVLGSFNSGQDQMMQLWMDLDSETDYYTANWTSNYPYNFTRINGNGQKVWTYNVANGFYASGISTDANFAYVIGYGGDRIDVLDKETGIFQRSINLPGQIYLYGSLVVANDHIYFGGSAEGWGNIPYSWNAIHEFLLDGTYVGSTSTPDGVYNASFDGEVMWVSAFSDTNYGFKISDGNAYSGNKGIEVVLTAIDAAGNSATDVGTVVVEDKLAPTITLSGNQVVQVVVGATFNDPGAIAVDNCSATVETSGNVNVNLAGTYTIFYKAIDGSGNESAQISRTVQVIELDVKTKDITVRLNASGIYTLDPSEVDNGSILGGGSLSLNITQLNCSNIGNPVTVTLTATSSSGNTATATAVVTVEDKIAPTVITQNATIQLNAEGLASISPSSINNGSIDNCAIATIGLSKTSFDCSNIGVNTVTLTVIDVNGNVSTANATVTVQDNVAPIVITQNRTIQLNAAGTASITAADINNGSTDNCSIASLVLSKTAFDCTNVGANTVTLTVTDVNGNVSTKTAVVTVEDKIAPIVITQNAIIQLNAEGLASISPSSINNGSTDNCSIASFVLSKTAFDCTNVGANTVTLTVTDVNGNVSTKTAVVTVEDNIAPIVLVQNRTIQLNAAGTASITAADINNGSTDNCSIASITLSKTAFDCTNVGANTVTLTVTDVNGNVSTKTAVVTVEDKIAPIVLVQNRTIQLNAAGNATITAADINNGSTDNCSIASIALSKTTFDCTNVGSNTVTLTVTDVNGNVSTKTAVVTVEDKIAPNITPLAFQEICFVASNTYSLPTLTATDNCSVASVSYVLSGATSRIGFGNNASGTLNTGLTTITWTVKDANGNVSTSSNDVRIWPLPVLTLTPSNADAFCNEVSLSPSSTIPVVAYRWMYNNTLFSTSAVLKLSIANADGNYQLFVTDIHGCVNTQIASYNFQKQGAISSYTILGLREVKLGENNKVLSGSVGAMGYKGKIDIKKNSSVAAAGAFVKAADIKVQSPSNVPTKIYAPVVTSLPTMQYFTGSTKNLAKVTASSNTTLTGNYRELTVKSGKTVTLTGSLFGKIEIEEGATVTFTSSVINIENLDVEGSSKAAYTNVLFSNDAIVKVSDKVDVERRSNINPTGKKVIFYVGSVKDHGKYYNNSHNDDDNCPSRGNSYGNDDDDDDHEGEYGNGEFKVNGGESIVNASVYVPNGKIKVNGGEKLTTNMTGMFIAYKVESSEKNVNWNGFSCSASAAPMLMATNSVQETEAPKQLIETASLELLSTKFLAYPNPFARQTTISFTLPYQDDNATVDIYDLRGVKVQSIFKGAAAAQTAVEVQFNGQNIAAGTYFFRLTTGKETKNFKVVMID